MLYREIIAVCSQIHTEHINNFCRQNVKLFIAEPGVRWINKRNLEGLLPARSPPRWNAHIAESFHKFQVGHPLHALVRAQPGSRVWLSQYEGSSFCFWQTNTKTLLSFHLFCGQTMWRWLENGWRRLTQNHIPQFLRPHHPNPPQGDRKSKEEEKFRHDYGSIERDELYGVAGV